MTRGSFAVAAVAVLALLGCPGRRPHPAGEIGSAVARGLACAAGAYDGNSFRDDYLRFVYPGEQLGSPLPGHPLTYRTLDAYFIVLMIRQAGVDPGKAGPLFDRAEAMTAALVPLWRRSGIYNLRRNPAPGGIALDSYAILAVLRRDREMARVVEAGLDGDGWLPADLYVGDEAFRRLADESWAARAVLVADPQAGVRILRGLCGEITRALETEKDTVARANLVIHALLALEDLRQVKAQEGAGLAEETRGPLRAEALRLLREESIRSDTLTLANLVGALLSDPAVGDEILAPQIRELRRRQDQDGCWQVSVAPADSSGWVFATLRVVLTLGDYQRLRLNS